MKDKPKVSCLCVTHKRASFLKIAIECFKSQIHPNKELVIVYRSSDSETKSLLSCYNGDDEIVRQEVDDKFEVSLGDLRNLSIEAASGEYICIWDDDDWHHAKRISIQLDSLGQSGKKASALLHVLIHDFATNSSFVSLRRPWEPTLFCEKEVLATLGIRYSPLNKGEDTPFLAGLIKHNLVFPLIKPELYIYNITGSNTCDRSHFDRIISMSQELSVDHSSIIGTIVGGQIKMSEASDKLSSVDFISSFRYLVHYPDELWKYIRYF